jgi:hypothetical protein
MTRDEAIWKLTKLDERSGHPSNREYQDQFLDRLEALGLIKFDEPVKPRLSAAVVKNGGCEIEPNAFGARCT